MGLRGETLARCACLLFTLTLATGCIGLHTHPEVPPVLEGARCRLGASQAGLLVTEWPASEKANLESALGQGAVAVAFSGCQLRLLPECRLPGRYAFSRTTPATDVIEIHNALDLYAKLPLGAAKLEGELRRSGALEVETTVSGQKRLQDMTAAGVTAAPECAGATHLVSGLSLGAFVMRAGAQFHGQAGAQVQSVGVGGQSSGSQRIVRTAGNAAACGAATDVEAPPDCASPIQVFLSPIPGRTAEVGPPGSVEVDFVSVEPSVRWDVFVNDDATCTTPCSRWVDPSIPLELRTRIGASSLTVPSLRPDHGPLQVAAHPTRMGELATGIVFTAFGGMALITGVTLTAIGCGDGGAACKAGLITGGSGMAVAAGGIWLLLDALPEVEVRPIFDGQLAIGISPTGVRGQF